MARRFAFITDEHISDEVVAALRSKDYMVVRVVDDPALGRSTLDPKILAHAVRRGYVWLTRDERAQGELKLARARGETLPGVVCWSQRHRGLGIGEILRQLEALEREEAPFVQGVRYLKPGGV